MARELLEKLENIKDNDSINESKQLNEGTSNFPVFDYFPLLVFYTYDEFQSMIDNHPDYPDYEDYRQEDENGHFFYDDEKYDEDRDAFEQKMWDEEKVRVLDEDEQERLEAKLAEFNRETQNICDKRYEEDMSDDEYNDLNLLEDIKLKLNYGYYSGAYVDVDNENEFDYMTKEFSEEQKARFNKFLDSIKEEFKLTDLELVSRASNGETSFKIKESADDEVAREEYCVLIDGNNVDVEYNEEDAIRVAREYAYTDEYEDSVVKVLLVKYGPKNEHGDEPELGIEVIWANKFNESVEKTKTNESIQKDGNISFEDGHTYEEYLDKYGDEYQEGNLWDFSEEDLKNGAIEPKNIVYWKITVDDEPRFFETTDELGESLKEDKNPKSMSKEELEAEYKRLKDEMKKVKEKNPTSNYLKDLQARLDKVAKYHSKYGKFNEELKEDANNKYLDLEKMTIEDIRTAPVGWYWEGDGETVIKIDEDKIFLVANHIGDTVEGYVKGMIEEFGSNAKLKDICDGDDYYENNLGIMSEDELEEYRDEWEDSYEPIEDEVEEDEEANESLKEDAEEKKIVIKPDSKKVQIDIEDKSEVGAEGHPIQKGLRGLGNLKVHEERISHNAKTEKKLDDLVFIEFDEDDKKYYLASDYDRYVWTNFDSVEDAEDFYKYHKSDVRWSISEELSEDMRKIHERKKKRYHVNFTGDPEKNCAFFNHTMGSDKYAGASEEGTATSTSEDLDLNESTLTEATKETKLKYLNELKSLILDYQEDLKNEDGDTFAGTEDSIANEHLTQNLYDLVTRFYKPDTADQNYQLIYHKATTDLDGLLKSIDVLINRVSSLTEDVDDKYDLDAHFNDEDDCIYQFPNNLTKSDIKYAEWKYNLKYLGKVNDRGFQPGDIIIQGKYKDLKKYCDEHLDYVMHPDYLYKAEDFDVEDTVTTESLQEDISEDKLAKEEEAFNSAINEGAEGKRVSGKEWVIYDASKEKTAPIVAIRKTHTEAEWYCRKPSNFGKELGIEEVPEGKFKKGDDFYGPFDAEYNKIDEARGKGLVCKYKGHSIIDAGDRYVITNEHGLNVGETKFGLPIAKGMIDDLVKDESLKESYLKESAEDFYVLSDGMNPKYSSVYSKIDNLDEFINDLEKNKVDGQYWELLHVVEGTPTVIWTTEKGRIR